MDKFVVRKMYNFRISLRLHWFRHTKTNTFLIISFDLPKCNIEFNLQEKYSTPMYNANFNSDLKVATQPIKAVKISASIYIAFETTTHGLPIPL